MVVNAEGAEVVVGNWYLSYRRYVVLRGDHGAQGDNHALGVQKSLRETGKKDNAEWTWGTEAVERKAADNSLILIRHGYPIDHAKSAPINVPRWYFAEKDLQRKSWDLYIGSEIPIGSTAVESSAAAGKAKSPTRTPEKQFCANLCLRHARRHVVARFATEVSHCAYSDNALIVTFISAEYFVVELASGDAVVNSGVQELAHCAVKDRNLEQIALSTGFMNSVSTISIDSGRSADGAGKLTSQQYVLVFCNLVDSTDAKSYAFRGVFGASHRPEELNQLFPGTWRLASYHTFMIDLLVLFHFNARAEFRATFFACEPAVPIVFRIHMVCVTSFAEQCLFTDLADKDLHLKSVICVASEALSLVVYVSDMASSHHE